MSTDDRPPLFLALLFAVVYGLFLVVLAWPKDTREWLASACASVAFWVLVAGVAHFAAPFGRVVAVILSISAGAVAGWVWWFVAAQGNAFVSVGSGVVLAIAMLASDGGLSKNVRAA